MKTKEELDSIYKTFDLYLPSCQVFKETLQRRLISLESKINIIKDAKDNQRAISIEESKLLDEHELPLLNDEIAIILQSKINKSRAKNPLSTYEPIILSPSEAESFYDYLSQNPLKENEQFDIILSSSEAGGHCTALQIASFNNTTTLIAIDASSVRDNFKIIDKYKSALALTDEKQYCFNLRTQSDNHNCSIFSIQDLNSIFKLSKRGIHSPNNSKFYKNSQSNSIIEEFKQTSSYDAEEIITGSGSKTKNLDQYVKEFSVSVEFIEDGVKKTKERNYNIILKKLKYLRGALELLEEITKQPDPDKTLREIISKRRGGESIQRFQDYYAKQSKTFIDAIKYTTAEGDVRLLTDIDKICLAANHGVDALCLANAHLAFSTPENSVLSTEYIVEGETTFDKNIRAQKLAKITNQNRFKALVKFGIEIPPGNNLFTFSTAVAARTLTAFEEIYEEFPGTKTQKQQAINKFYQLFKDSTISNSDFIPLKEKFKENMNKPNFLETSFSMPELSTVKMVKTFQPNLQPSLTPMNPALISASKIRNSR